MVRRSAWFRPAYSTRGFQPTFQAGYFPHKEIHTWHEPLTKHVARRQDVTFAGWFTELRELAGDRWSEVADQAPTIRGLGRRRDTATSTLHGWLNLAAENNGMSKPTA
jgi:hypothetical protein